MKLGEIKPTIGAVKNTKRRGRGPGTGLGRTGGRGGHVVVRLSNRSVHPEDPD